MNTIISENLKNTQRYMPHTYCVTIDVRQNKKKKKKAGKIIISSHTNNKEAFFLMTILIQKNNTDSKIFISYINRILCSKNIRKMSLYKICM